MPHIIVKLWPGRTDEQKNELTKKIADAVIKTLNASDKSISVAFEETPQNNWTEEVYIPDILSKEKNLYKKPGYTPADLESEK